MHHAPHEPDPRPQLLAHPINCKLLQAPEVVACPLKQTPCDNKSAPGTHEYSTAADTWAVGGLLYAMITGEWGWELASGMHGMAHVHGMAHEAHAHVCSEHGICRCGLR
jgi:hypothetical protein